MRYRNSWLASALKFKFPAGQMRAMYLNGVAPLAIDSTSETMMLINAGYPAAMITQAAATRGAKWNVFLNSSGLTAMREGRREALAPFMGQGLQALSSRFDRIGSTPAVRHRLRPTTDAATLARYRASTMENEYGNPGTTSTLKPADLSDLMAGFFGDSSVGTQNVVIPNSTMSYVNTSPPAYVMNATDWLTKFPAVAGQTWLCTWIQSGYFDGTSHNKECSVMLGVQVNELVPGLTHLFHGGSYNSSWPANDANPTAKFGIWGGMGTPSAREFIRRFVTTRNIVVGNNVYYSADTTFGWKDTTDVTPSAGKLKPYLLNQIGGSVAEAGWVVGEAWLAAMPEFCDAFCVRGPLTLDDATKTATFSATPEFGLSFPPSILSAMRSMNPDATAQAPEVTQRIYSWVGPVKKVATGILDRLALKSLAKKADLVLADETFIDEPAAEGRPAMKMTFGEAAKKAEGQTFQFCHYMEPDVVSPIDTIIFSGKPGSFVATAYAAGVSSTPDADAIMAHLMEGGSYLNATSATITNDPQPSDDIVLTAVAGVTKADISAQTTGPASGFNLRNVFSGGWPAFTYLGSQNLAACHLVCFSMDQRPMHQLAVTSMAWSQIREDAR